MTLREVRRHRAAIDAFHEAFVAYYEVGRDGDPELRVRVVELAPGAEAALNAVGTVPTVDSRREGGHLISGLANMMFLHEKPGWGSVGTGRSVIDTSKLASGRLLQREETIRRQRRNPLYWGDRIVRVLLGIPAYIISRLVGKSFERIDGSSFGIVLRLVSAAGSIAAIYFGGAEAGWW